LNSTPTNKSVQERTVKKGQVQASDVFKLKPELGGGDFLQVSKAGTTGQKKLSGDNKKVPKWGKKRVLTQGSQTGLNGVLKIENRVVTRWAPG